MPPIDYTVPAPFARSYDAGRYRLLVDEAVRVLAKRFRIAFVAQGVVYLDDGGEGSSADLKPLLRDTVGVTQQGQLLDRVHAHVSRMLYAVEGREGAGAKPYAQVRRKLIARLYPDDGRFATGAFVTAEHLPGVVSVLMLDDEGAFASVDPAMLDGWGVDAAAAFHVAIENSSRRKPEVQTRHPDTPSGTLTLHLIAEENHASGFALALPMFGRRYLGEHGALVSVPSRALALVTPLRAGAPTAVCDVFAATTGGLTAAEYARHDRPVSTGVYWLDPLGTFVAVDVTRAGGRVWAKAPERLAASLAA